MNPRRYNRALEQDRLASQVALSMPNSRLIPQLTEIDKRFINAGQLGGPFEKHVASVLRDCRFNPLVTSRMRIDGHDISPTGLFSGVEIRSGQRTILEIDGLIAGTQSHGPICENFPVVIESKSGKPHNAFDEERISLISRIVMQLWNNLNGRNQDDVGFAFSIVTPARKWSNTKPWERDLANSGAQVVRTPFTLGEFHKQIIRLLSNRT